MLKCFRQKSDQLIEFASLAMQTRFAEMLRKFADRRSCVVIAEVVKIATVAQERKSDHSFARDIFTCEEPLDSEKDRIR